MAHAGSGGWFPSQGFYIDYRGRIERAGSTQNKPRESILSVEDAVQTLRHSAPGTIVQIDVRHGNPAKLIALWEDGTLT